MERIFLSSIEISVNDNETIHSAPVINSNTDIITNT